jgi:hypothetical protein
MTKTYHIPFSTDGEANKAFWEIRGRVVNAGGNSHVSPSLGHGRAYIVMHLSDSLTTEQINEITHPHTADEVIVLEIAKAQDLPESPAFDEEDDEDDDEFPFDDDDEEDDEGWDDLDDALYLDDEEDEDDEPEEEAGNGAGEPGGDESPEPEAESGEATSLGSAEGQAE